MGVATPYLQTRIFDGFNFSPGRAFLSCSSSIFLLKNVETRSRISFWFRLGDSISEGVKSRVREEVLPFADGEGFDVSGDVVFFEDVFVVVLEGSQRLVDIAALSHEIIAEQEALIS